MIKMEIKEYILHVNAYRSEPPLRNFKICSTLKPTFFRKRKLNPEG